MFIFTYILILKIFPFAGVLNQGKALWKKKKGKRKKEKRDL